MLRKMPPPKDTRNEAEKKKKAEEPHIVIRVQLLT